MLSQWIDFEKRILKNGDFAESKNTELYSNTILMPPALHCISRVLSCVSQVLTHICMYAPQVHILENLTVLNIICFPFFISDLRVSYNSFDCICTPFRNSFQIHPYFLSTKLCVFFPFFFNPSRSICVAKIFLDMWSLTGA